MKPADTSTRRYYPRLKTDAHATLILEDKTKLGLRLTNVSVSGVGGSSNQFIKPGKEAGLILYHPFLTDLTKKQVKIIWCKKKDEKSCSLGLDFGYDRIDLSAYSKNK